MRLSVFSISYASQSISNPWWPQFTYKTFSWVVQCDNYLHEWNSESQQTPLPRLERTYASLVIAPPLMQMQAPNPVFVDNLTLIEIEANDKKGHCLKPSSNYNLYWHYFHYWTKMLQCQYLTTLSSSSFPKNTTSH